MAISFDVLCAGIIVADNVCHPIPIVPPPGTLTLTEKIEFSIGGCSANIAVDLARLGLKVGLSGRIGADASGREIKDRLSDACVDVSQIETSSNLPTSTTFVLNVSGEDRRFIHCAGANGEYDGSELNPDVIRNSKIVYVGGFCLLQKLTPERVAAIFRIARESSVTTVLNVVISESTDTMAWLKPVLELTDYFICNNDEARRITGQTDPLQQAEALRTLGTKVSIVTMGEKGAVFVGPDCRMCSSVYPVKPIDGTGTGDAFAAGFLYGVLQGRDSRDCIKLGAAMGASCVQSMGATTGVFNKAELEAYVCEKKLAIKVI